MPNGFGLIINYQFTFSNAISNFKTITLFFFDIAGFGYPV
jgi:hypothetical protein